MHAQVTTAVRLAFFSPSCFSGYYVNSELKQNSLFGPFQSECIGNMNFVNLNLYRIVYFNVLTSIFNRQR